MTQIKLNGKMVDVDVLAELEEHRHVFRKLDDKGTHWNACSPFRNDTHPSFYVYVEDTATAKAGYWGDHAADDDEYMRGGLLKLLAYLRDESLDATESYLIAKYGSGVQPDDDGQFRLKNALGRVQLDDSGVESLRWITYRESHKTDVRGAQAYLAGRGISAETFRAYEIGQKRNSVAIPWVDGRGELLNVKYRNIDDKRFSFASGGADINDSLFGVQMVYKTGPLDSLYIVESEIDALYLHTLGFVAVALGGRALNRKRIALLGRMPYDKLVIVPDMDEPGIKTAQSIIDNMITHKDVFIAPPPDGYKDINEVEPDIARTILESPEQINPLVPAINFESDV